jgi:pimeloyl-ACP methyl ester carboxylesterase
VKGSRRRGGARVAVALLAGLLGCSTAAGGSHTGTSQTGASSTTTTTLPTPIVISGTQPTGTTSFLGAVMRVAVQPLAAGTSVPTTSSAAPLTVAFRQFGSGPDVLLVMGQSGSMTWWEPSFLQALDQHFRVTIFDLPAVGYSGPDTVTAPSIGRYADVTAGLVDALGLSSPVLLGWGMGGEVALEVLVRHPGLAARAVLADTSAGGPASLPTPPAAERELAAPSSTVALLDGLLFPGNATSERAAWLIGSRAAAPDDVVPAALADEATAQSLWWTSGATPAQLKDLGAPVMVLWGADDGVFPPADGSALAAAVPGDTVLTLPGDGYGALFASPGTVVQAITAFAQAS